MNDPWTTAQNPLLSHHDWSIKDPALAHNGDEWIIATSMFNDDRSTIGILASKDLFHWDEALAKPRAHWHGPENGWIGYCSPNIVFADNQWIIVANTWGDTRTEKMNRFFYWTTDDWQRFSDPQPLAADILNGIPVIDASLAHHNGSWFLLGTGCHPKINRIATAPSLTGPWQWLSDDAISLHAATLNSDNGYMHENGQFIHDGQQWHLLTTDYRPHQPWLYQLAGNPDEAASWIRWHEGRPLLIHGEKWNDVDTINSAALWDHRHVDGYWYAIFAGKGMARSNEFLGKAGRKPWPRGWNHLGIARSKDLLRWSLPGTK